MAQFSYKALTKNGQIVKNRVEEGNKLTLVRKLKLNRTVPDRCNTNTI